MSTQNTKSSNPTSGASSPGSPSGASTSSSSGQDLCSVLGGILKDCTTKWNEDANENMDIITRDVKNLYTQFGSLVYSKSNMLQMSAEEIRNKTVEDLLQSDQIRNSFE